MSTTESFKDGLYARQTGIWHRLLRRTLQR